MGSKFTSQGSRATQPLLMYGSDSEVGTISDQGIAAFGRNVLICSNLSYCNRFEYIRSFIAGLSFQPFLSIAVATTPPNRGPGVESNGDPPNLGPGLVGVEVWWALRLGAENFTACSCGPGRDSDLRGAALGDVPDLGPINAPPVPGADVKLPPGAVRAHPKEGLVIVEVDAAATALSSRSSKRDSGWDPRPRDLRLSAQPKVVLEHPKQEKCSRPPGRPAAASQ